MESRKHQIDSKQPLKHKKPKTKLVVEGSGEDIRLAEVIALIRTYGAGAQESGHSSDVVLPPFARFTELEVDILELGSWGSSFVQSIFSDRGLGDGLGIVQNGKHVIIVPFTVPGSLAIFPYLIANRRQGFGTDIFYYKVRAVTYHIYPIINTHIAHTLSLTL
jgi:hypothetical protein